MKTGILNESSKTNSIKAFSQWAFFIEASLFSNGRKMKFKKHKSLILLALLGLGLIHGVPVLGQDLLKDKVAFLSDIHLQDVYGDFDSEEFKGVISPKTGRLATIRTMEAQLNSTRLFNENYFALYSALDELAKKGIKLVVLPGDFTDDGQPMNVKKLKEILTQYSNNHEIRFLITTGNHDPVTPFSSPGGKADFLGEDFTKQAIYSRKSLSNVSGNAPAFSKEVQHWGYEEITNELQDFGFFPSLKDLFWSHPFEKLDYENYSFEKAKQNSKLENRTFPIENSTLIHDASYLIEPIEGLWLLAIDGNTYFRRGNPDQLSGSSIGFNEAVNQKPHQLDWIKKVSEEAKRLGKTLISFSHYPLVDFNDGSSSELKELFGKGKFQLSRVPDSKVSNQYLNAGLQIHFAGHMHSNDTGIFIDSIGNQLYNIQVPSLAAFPPAYKILSFPEEDVFQIETEILNSVSGMDEFFDLYQMEWNKANWDQKEVWDQKILASKDYFEYCKIHLDELIRLRFLKADWPEPIKSTLLSWNLQDLTYWAGLHTEELSDQFLIDRAFNSQHEKVIQDKFEMDQKTWDLLRAVSGKTIISDFYQLKNGGELAFNDQNEFRFSCYSKIFQNIISNKKPTENLTQNQILLFARIFLKIQHGLPSDNFYIDLNRKKIFRIKQELGKF